MRFRPCIDIHNGKVKQIVGSSLKDQGDLAAENFVSEADAAFYARMYESDGLAGGHVIMLNSASSPYYEETRREALQALRAAPGKLHAGGGINPENAEDFLQAGASHVIVTSYVFSGGRIDEKKLERMVQAVGKEHLVLDLSCIRDESGSFRIVTDRWQKVSDIRLDHALLQHLKASCDEYLVHAVDAEGKRRGPLTDLLKLLGSFAARPSEITYAGGISSQEDIDAVERAGNGKIDFTAGSALDLFGGSLSYRMLCGKYA